MSDVGNNNDELSELKPVDTGTDAVDTSKGSSLEVLVYNSDVGLNISEDDVYSSVLVPYSSDDDADDVAEVYVVYDSDDTSVEADDASDKSRVVSTVAYVEVLKS